MQRVGTCQMQNLNVSYYFIFKAEKDYAREYIVLFSLTLRHGIRTNTSSTHYPRTWCLQCHLLAKVYLYPESVLGVWLCSHCRRVQDNKISITQHVCCHLRLNRASLPSCFSLHTINKGPPHFSFFLGCFSI